MTGRVYSNQAVQTTIASSNFGATSVQLVVASNQGYPTASPAAPFTLRINPGAPDEEIVDVIGGLGTQASPWILSTENIGGVQVRSKDGTVSKEWAQGTPVVHGFSARDFNEIQQTVEGSQALISNAFPVGAICLWYGAKPVPPKFAICDGKAYNTTTGNQATPGSPGSITTPDLRTKFVLGAGDASGNKPPNSEGGSNAMTKDTMPSHTHTESTQSHNHGGTVTGGTHAHNMRYEDGFDPVFTGGKGWKVPVTVNADGVTTAFMDYSGAGAMGGHTHTVANDSHKHTIDSTGTTTNTENNMPRYMALYYIMRIKP